jgi:DNA-binding transcriptional MerR regulator
MAFSTNPAFNLKVILQETRIHAETLRAWERRYGLPQPQRTAGGHRLYSQYDIETIKWLLQRQEEGLSISRAVDLWNEHHASGVDPLEGFAPNNLNTAPALPAVYIPPNTNLDSLREKWVSACMKFSETGSDQVLNQAFSIFPVESVCVEILQKGMADIGSLWFENKLSIQQEHFASGLAMRRIDSLLSASPAPSRNQTVLVGCPANEWHTFTPMLISLFLRRRGLNVIYLGANVPAADFEKTVKSVHGSLVLLVAQTLITAAALQQTAQALAGLRIPIGYGGRIFNLQPALQKHIPGTLLGNTIISSLDTVEKLLQSKIKATPTDALPAEYVTAHQAFVTERTQIESSVKKLVQFYSIKPEDLNTGIQFLGDNIAAALQLGSMDYITHEVDWLKDLVKHHQRPMASLSDFMHIYGQAVDKHIREHGRPIKAWLNLQGQDIRQ